MRNQALGGLNYGCEGVKQLTVYTKAYQVAIVHAHLTSLNAEFGKMLRSMHDHPVKFLTPIA